MFTIFNLSAVSEKIAKSATSTGCKLILTKNPFSSPLVGTWYIYRTLISIMYLERRDFLSKQKKTTIFSSFYNILLTFSRKKNSYRKLFQ